MGVRTEVLFDTADILGSDTEDGEVRLELGDVVTGVGTSTDTAMWGIDGFVSRPSDPDKDECARALYLVDGDEKIVVVSQDNRFSDKVGKLEAGDRAIVSKGEQRVLLKQTGEQVILYTVNQVVDLSMQVILDGANGVLTLSNGNAIVELKNDGISMSVSENGQMKGYLTVNKKGVQVGGDAFAANTGSGSLGLVGGLLPPPPTNGLAHGVSGPVNVISTSWTVAP